MSTVESQRKWDYYHSLFFVITVVSTIGYGNLAPTTTFTRLFMILYGLIGIPMNGIVMVTLGEFFGKSFIKLYHRWKATRVKYELATAGLVGQICLYFIPGFMFFMILPSTIFVWYEGWPYDVAIYYAFVTLTTIGFGDYVAGTTENSGGTLLYTIYQIFLFFWVILGLGYIVMILGFISRILSHRKIHEIQHKLAISIKKTPQRIREELRTVLNEFLVMRVKRVYREKFPYVYTGINRSQSCPDLELYSKNLTLIRKRAYSECIQPQVAELERIMSDTELDLIDKERTFQATNALLEPSKLILQVVNALGEKHEQNFEYDLFSDKEILESENMNKPIFEIGEDNSKLVLPLGTKARKRAKSEVRFSFENTRTGTGSENNDLTWHGIASPLKFKPLHQQMKPLQTSEQSFLSRMKSIFRTSNDDIKTVNKEMDAEKQDIVKKDIIQHVETAAVGGRQPRVSFFESSKSPIRKGSLFVPTTDQLLEETSLADFIRAIASISLEDGEESPQPKRKLGTACLPSPLLSDTGPKRRLTTVESQTNSRIFNSSNNKRRTSLMPTKFISHNQSRRMSLRPELINRSEGEKVKFPTFAVEKKKVSLKEDSSDEIATLEAKNLSMIEKETFTNNSNNKSDKTGRFYVIKEHYFVNSSENSPVERQVSKRLEKDDSNNSS